MTVLDAHGNRRFCGLPSNAINEAQAWPDEMIAVGVLENSLADQVTIIEQQDDLLAAMARWAEHTARLNYQHIQTNATERAHDITLAYRAGAHGDGQPFDGEGRVVGHAWFPPDGRIHLDNAEFWSLGFRRVVTLHEVGHALGLGHAAALGNIMYPYVTTQTDLGPWDVAQIQQRYGAATPEPGDPEPPTIPRPPMLWGVRREAITIDGAPVPEGQMIKMLVNAADSGEPLAESAYFEDGFFLFEIPQPQTAFFGVKATSPVETKFTGPFAWQSGALVWSDGLDFVALADEEPEPSPWLPWRTAELEANADGLRIRFLDTRSDATDADLPFE